MKDTWQSPRNILLAFNLTMREQSKAKLGKISNINNTNIIIKYVRYENTCLWNKDKICNICLESLLPNINIENELSKREEITNWNDNNRRLRRKRTITRSDSLKNKEWTNEEKDHKIMRIFVVNLNGFRPKLFKKIK